MLKCHRHRTPRSHVKTTSNDFFRALFLIDFIVSQQLSTLGELPEIVRHPVEALLQSYKEEGIPDHTEPPWPRKSLESIIEKVPHTSAYSPEITALIHEEMQQYVRGGFSILILTANLVQLFGRYLKISCIAAAP